VCSSDLPRPRQPLLVRSENEAALAAGTIVRVLEL